MSINPPYALIHLTGDPDLRNRSRVHVVDLVSGEIHPRPMVNLHAVSQAVLRCDPERGEKFTVLALTEDGTLVVDRGEEDALDSSSTAPPALSPLHGFTPKALSADGTRALCFVGAVPPFPGPRTPAPPRFCVVDTATGEILSGPFEGERPSEIIGEDHRRDIRRYWDSRGMWYNRGGWFWSTLHGRLYRAAALDVHEHRVDRVAVTNDGSMVVWSDRRGVVRFHRNVGDV
ncbi:uncharacterized protein BXZ73DRAFT_100972 [Epithele typhae]|uniref:uncharacterized protein n=1 Tax=Epithele typhae TaxID=378194 RepID=UPI0020074660|nr:uncharacterized protein BXZ73DRAFT_100972 [Epithele typhae]KAH9933590.1 hypothetical protein BXZ73DRAFT_100972 [Epithele typhae]